MRRARWGLVVCLLFLGCPSGRLHPGQMETWRATPVEVQLGTVWVGFPKAAQVTLFNPGSVAATQTLSISAPFTVSPSSLTLEGGASAMVTVALAPSAAAELHGTLTAGALSVPLGAIAQVPPDCGAAPDCHAVGFDPDAGVCASSVAPDGTGCATPRNCFTAAECRAGRCVGTTTNCDDGNPCTLDVCGVNGCGQIDATSYCPAPTALCQAPLCDSDAGCGFAAVPDGTACGVRDCHQADVCLGGLCKTVSAPQLQSCADVVVGVPAGPGNIDGPARVARFGWMTALTYAPNGNLYVLDGNAVRRVEPNGDVQLVAGSDDYGFAVVDGIGSAARFAAPTAMVWFDGALVVYDSCTLRRVTPQGLVSTWVGVAFHCGADDGIGAQARLEIGQLAVSDTGTLLLASISDASADIVVRETSTLGEVTTAGRFTLSDASASWVYANDTRVTSVARVNGDFSGCVNSADPGLFQLASWSFVTLADGGASATRQDDWSCFASVAEGANLLTTGQHQLLRAYPDGGLDVLAGSVSGSADGPASAATFALLGALAEAPDGSVAIADEGNNNLRVLHDGVVSTLAGPIPDRRFVDGPVSSARLVAPTQLIVTASQDVYFIDGLSSRGRTAIRHLDASGQRVDTLAGSDDGGYPDDGIGAAAQFESLFDLVDYDGTQLMVTDGSLRTVQLATGEVKTLWRPGYTGMSMTAALAKNGTSVLATRWYYDALVDAFGKITPISNHSDAAIGWGAGWLSVDDGTQTQLIQFPLGGGTATSLNPSGSGVAADGPLAQAQFLGVSDLAVDGFGTIYALDPGDANAVRRIRNGVVDTVAFLSDQPQGIACEANGDVLVVVPSAILRLHP